MRTNPLHNTKLSTSLIENLFVATIEMQLGEMVRPLIKKIIEGKEVKKGIEDLKDISDSEFHQV